VVTYHAMGADVEHTKTPWWHGEVLPLLAWPQTLQWLSGDAQTGGRDAIKVACKPHQE